MYYSKKKVVYGVEYEWTTKFGITYWWYVKPKKYFNKT